MPQNRTKDPLTGRIAPIHGQTGTKLFNIWLCMRYRCNGSMKVARKDYFEKGIRVCDEWATDFMVFKAWAYSNGYCEGLTIERKENHLGYSPGNCTWATMKQQARNRTNNHLVTAFSETKCIMDWVDDSRCAVSKITLRQRLIRGWNPEIAITKQAEHTKSTDAMRRANLARIKT